MNEDLTIIFGEKGAAQLAASVAHIDRTVKSLSHSADAMEKELGQGGKAMADMGRQAQQAGGLIGGLGRELSGVFGTLAIGVTVKESIDAFADFGQGLADLSSITGLVGDDLANMGEVARQMGVDVEGGATGYLKAVEIIGSQKPELLSSAEALQEMAAATDVLADASGEAMAQSASNLTGIMNQFGAGVEQVDRFINVLAAGSLEGAANITQLAESMKVSGSIASGFNVSVEESIAALETLADKSIFGAEAGTALRNVLARMAATEALPKRAREALAEFGVNLEIVSDKTLPFSERLKEMSKVAGDTAAIVEIFGIENQAAAQILLNSTKRVEDLTKSVTGTNTAYEQAQTRTKTFKEEMKRLGRQMQDLAITAGEALKPIVSILADIAGAVADVIKFFIENKLAAIALAGGIALLNSSYIAATVSLIANRVAMTSSNAVFAIQYYWLVATQAATAAYATTVGMSTVAMRVAATAAKLFGNAIKANPIGVAIVGVTALAAAVYAFTRNSKDATEAEKRRKEITEGINSAMKEASAQIGKETASLELLVRGIKNENASKSEKKALTDQLLAQYGGYLTQMEKEAVAAGNIEAAYKKIKTAIIENITAKQKATAIEDLFGKELAAQRDNAAKLSQALARQVEFGRMDKAFSTDQILKFTETFRQLPAELQRAADAGVGISLAAQKNFDLTPLQVETLAFFDDFSKLYNKLDKESAELGRSADATPFVREFNKITGSMDALDAGIAEINSKFGNAFSGLFDVGQAATDAGTGIADASKEAIAAAGSIEALQKRIEDLQKAFNATGDAAVRNQLGVELEKLAVQLERMQNGPVLDLVKPEAIQSVSDLNGQLANSIRTFEEMPAAVDSATESLTRMGALAKALGEDRLNILKEGLTQIKGAFVDFGATAAQSIGYAIGSATSAAEAFGEALRGLLVEIPRLAGMALLNAAAFPGNAAIALPLAIAGLALLGLSGLIKGFGDRKKQQRESRGENMESMGSVASRAPGGLAGLASAGQDRPIEVNIGLEMNGIAMNGVIQRARVEGDKHRVKTG